MVIGTTIPTSLYILLFSTCLCTPPSLCWPPPAPSSPPSPSLAATWWLTEEWPPLLRSAATWKSRHIVVVKLLLQSGSTCKYRHADVIITILISKSLPYRAKTLHNDQCNTGTRIHTHISYSSVMHLKKRCIGSLVEHNILGNMYGEKGYGCNISYKY